MEWVYIVFAIGTIVYTVLIVRDYILDVRLQNTLRETLAAECLELEAQVKKSQREQLSIKDQIHEVGTALII